MMQRTHPDASPMAAPLPLGVLALIVAVTLGYVLVAELAKHAFYARAGAT